MKFSSKPVVDVPRMGILSHYRVRYRFHCHFHQFCHHSSSNERRFQNHHRRKPKYSLLGPSNENDNRSLFLALLCHDVVPVAVVDVVVAFDEASSSTNFQRRRSSLFCFRRRSNRSRKAASMSAQKRRLRPLYANWTRRWRKFFDHPWKSAEIRHRRRRRHSRRKRREGRKRRSNDDDDDDDD